MSTPADVQGADGLPHAHTPVLIGAFTLLLIAGPLIALAFATHWSDFHFPSGDAGSIGVSVGYRLISLVLIVALGTPLAWWLARHSFHGNGCWRPSSCWLCSPRRWRWAACSLPCSGPMARWAAWWLRRAWN